jgi:hypothetical protein
MKGEHILARTPRRWRNFAVHCEVKRTVDRQFLLLPTLEVRNIIGACLGRALEKFPVRLHWADANVNHLHIGRSALPNKTQNLSHFNQHFYSLLSRELNRLWDREGSVWSSRVRSREAIDDQSLERQLFYSVTNMVKDGLVDKVTHSKGFSCYNSLATGKTEKYWFYDRTAWWKQGGPLGRQPLSTFRRWVEVKFEPIAAWENLPTHKWQAHFRREVRRIEQTERANRGKEERRVMSPVKLAKLNPRARPKTRNIRTRQPLCHASDMGLVADYKKEWREFLDAFYRASGQFLSGNFHVEFPDGSFRPPLVSLYTASAL